MPARNLTVRPGSKSRFAAPAARVVLYVRVSSKEQNVEGFSLAAQLRLLRDYAAGKGFAIDHEFTDVESLDELMNYDRVTAAKLGITVQSLDAALYGAFGQSEVSIIYTQLNQYYVVLEVAPQYWQSPEGLKDIYLAGTGVANNFTMIRRPLYSRSRYVPGGGRRGSRALATLRLTLSFGSRVASGPNLVLGARTRRSASLAISRARRRARSERPPSAIAWMRQAILRNRNCL
jgi:hypothetical protein